jgi:hypothetical protein
VKYSLDLMTAEMLSVLACSDESFQRVPDGGPWSAYQSPASRGVANMAPQDKPWTPGQFEIRVFDVEQADSQLSKRGNSEVNEASDK